jgi:molybdopterin converting factor small subunit
MPTVWIPPLLRSLAGGLETVNVAGATIGQIIDGLDQQFPGIKGKLVESGQLKPGIAMAIDATAGRFPLSQPIPPDSEVHFLPSLSGGAR